MAVEAGIHNNNEGHVFRTDMEYLNCDENRLTLGEEMVEEEGKVSTTELSQYFIAYGAERTQDSLDIPAVDALYNYTSQQEDDAVVFTDALYRLELTKILGKSIKQVLSSEKMLGYFCAFGASRFSAMQNAVLYASMNTANNSRRLHIYKTVRFYMQGNLIDHFFILKAVRYL